MEILIFVAILLSPLIYLALQYNAFVALRNHIRESWSNIDTELKRRYELIPNLVHVVKGYAAHEKQVLERVVELRNKAAANHGKVASQCADEKAMVDGLQRMLALVENYPQLRADRHFLELQRELVNTEDRIQAARRFYNGNIREYSTKRDSFPTNIVAGLFHLDPEDYFDVEPAVRQHPGVSESFHS